MLTSLTRLTSLLQFEISRLKLETGHYSAESPVHKMLQYLLPCVLQANAVQLVLEVGIS